MQRNVGQIQQHGMSQSWGPIYKDSYADLTKKLRLKKFLGKSYESANLRKILGNTYEKVMKSYEKLTNTK